MAHNAEGRCRLCLRMVGPKKRDPENAENRSEMFAQSSST